MDVQILGLNLIIICYLISPKYSNREAWANSVDPDQTPQNAVYILGSPLFASRPAVLEQMYYAIITAAADAILIFEYIFRQKWSLTVNEMSSLIFSEKTKKFTF